MNARNALAALFSATLLLGAVGVAFATPIQPQGYRFTPPTGAGMYDYADPGFSKLSDGIKGHDDWIDPYAPWVGWHGISEGGSGTGVAGYTPVDVSIEFAFLAGDTVGSVVVGTNQDAVNNWNVVLPSLAELYLVGTGDDALLDAVYTPFSIGNSGSDTNWNNGRRHDLTLSFDPVTFTTETTLRLVLNNRENFALATSAGSPIVWDNTPGSGNNGMFWIFADEVAFDTTPVPEPSTLVLLASGLIGIAAYRRRRPSR